MQDILVSCEFIRRNVTHPEIPVQNTNSTVQTSYSVSDCSIVFILPRGEIRISYPSERNVRDSRGKLKRRRSRLPGLVARKRYYMHRVDHKNPLKTIGRCVSNGPQQPHATHETLVEMVVLC